MNGDWWWHVFHDPMNENPWSFAALVVAVLIIIAPLVALEMWRSRRIKKRWKQ